ncbi:hypothetical protein M3Y99_01299300 [Aphelenchoides fujianensis]|nr:hypothetical protein M3Y99_01299300 [Aphelenchoides fujianensis]
MNSSEMPTTSTSLSSPAHSSSRLRLRWWTSRRCLLMFFASITALDLVSHAYAQVVIKRFSQEHCRSNPCLNGGTCMPGKIACDCATGWMGRYCHRRCRNIYQSCDRWALEEKCEVVRTQTNFFDINCAISCKTCTADPSVKLSPIPLAPALEPLQFMMGKWYSAASKGLRFPTDMFSNEYEEVLDIMPAEVPMFGAPSLNLTSISWSGDDVRVVQGFLTLKPNSIPPEVAILSAGNEGLNMIELGMISNHAATFNVSYMQVHPALNNDFLPLGATRRFRRAGQLLEMTVAKLFSENRIMQFKKMFRKVRSYPY